MTQTTFRAQKITPIREQPTGTYNCQRCGIQRPTRPTRNQTHCQDCRPWAKEGT